MTRHVGGKIIVHVLFCFVIIIYYDVRHVVSIRFVNITLYIQAL